ncbi:MAG: AMP-binding protein [Anaerolineales bacterium]|nr:AMP-binding protein [Anaerolineales bacterium]
MKTFPQELIKTYQEVPEQVAIHLLFNHKPDKPVTYRQLFRGAAGYARALDQAKVQPGEVVILILDHGEDLIYAFFGSILHGAIPSIMPFLTEKLSPEHYHQSLQSLFMVTAPSVVITDREFMDEVSLAINDTTSVRSVLISSDIILESDLEPDHIQEKRFAPDDIVLLQHSSGTTGLQKGVALSHRAIFNQLESYRGALDVRDSDVIVSWLPLYHDMGLIAGFILPVLSRIPLVLLSPFDWIRAPHKLMRAISDHKGTLSWLPNFAYNFCAQKIREKDLQSVNLTSWRAVINCSEPIHWNSHKMFLERFSPYGLRKEALASSYAMAENVFAVTQGGIDTPITTDIVSQEALISHQIAVPSPNNHKAVKMVSAGRTIANTNLRVLDSKGKNLPERYIGEISIKSDCMLTGYYNRPNLTQKAFLDGWYLTGDLGYLANGELYITGRKKDLIIVGGKNIYPQDIERLAEEITGVYPGRVVAFGVFNEQIGTEDVVVIAESNLVDQEERLKIADEIRKHVTQNSDVALRYVQVVNRGWLLKTSSGKIAHLSNKHKYLEEMQNV